MVKETKNTTTDDVSFNSDGTLTELGKKEYQEVQKRKAARSNKKKYPRYNSSSRTLRGFNLYDNTLDIDTNRGDINETNKN